MNAERRTNPGGGVASPAFVLRSSVLVHRFFLPLSHRLACLAMFLIVGSVALLALDQPTKAALLAAFASADLCAACAAAAWLAQGSSGRVPAEVRNLLIVAAVLLAMVVTLASPKTASKLRGVAQGLTHRADDEAGPGMRVRR